MEREALVVGINRYPTFIQKHGKRPPHLEAAANDAEEIAQLLEKYGRFYVTRLPETYQGEQRKVDSEGTTNVATLETAIPTQKGQQKLPRKVAPDGSVKVAELKTAIQNLFNPPDNKPPDTALLFFAGHGLRQETNGVPEGFLVTSDACPLTNDYGLSLKWLEEQLEKSQVRQQIVWLDCCYSGEFLNFVEDKIKECDQAERDRCFIAACRSFQVSLASEHGVLTEALLEGLKPENYGNDFVTSYALVDFIKQQMAQAAQQPVFHNYGRRAIILTTELIEKPADARYQGICPYRSLGYFTRHHKHAFFFHGREALTQKLINRVENDNFIAVLGASGSGKSSLLRAGLLYQLRRGQQLPGSDRWQFFEPFTPGSDPLERLQLKIWQLLKVASPVLSDKEEELRQDPLKMLALLSQTCCAWGQRMVLVIDQFDECFTLCQDEEKRKQFFTCLLKALEQTENKLCIAIGLRSDCRGKLAQYQEFYEKVSKSFINVQHLNRQEIEAAIRKPAEKVKLKAPNDLVNAIVGDLEGYPGSLPLLESILTELWEKAQINRSILLELDIYRDAKVLEKTLENRADQVYKKLSDEEKKVARRIFLELTGFNDSQLIDRQVYLQTLANSQHSLELLEKVSDKLASEKARLIVKAEDEQSGKTSLKIIHKSLICNWPQLQKWIEKYREPIQTERNIEEKAKDWRKNQDRESLLQGNDLKRAEEYLKQYRDLGMLDESAQDYIQESCQVRNERQERELKQEKRKFVVTFVLLVVLSVLTGIIYKFSVDEKQQLDTLKNSHEDRVKALADLSSTLINFDQKYESLVEAIPVAEEPSIADSISGTLQKALFNRNGFVEIHRLILNSNANSVSFNPVGTVIASAGEDKTVNLWSSEGNFIRSLPLLEYWVNEISFSPDGKKIASASRKSVMLWSLKDKCLNSLPSSYKAIDNWSLKDECFKELKDHGDWVNAVSFSPDGTMIATASKDKTVKLWTSEGKLKRILHHENFVNSVSFSPDGKMIASGSGKSVMLWSIKDKCLNRLPPSYKAIDNRFLKDECFVTKLKDHDDWVNAVSFSPDGNMIASASFQTVNLWTREGEFLKSLPHSKWVNSISFGSDLNNNMLVSAGEDRNINVWRIKGEIKPEKSSSLQVELEQTLHQQDDITSVSISHDDRTIASSSKNKTISLWHKSQSPHPHFKQFKQNDDPNKDNHGVNSVSFSPDGKMIASAGQNKTVQIRTVKGKFINSLPHQDDVASVSINGNRMIASASGKNVKLWNVKGKEPIKCFSHNALVTSVSFSHDSKTIASVSLDGKVNLWSVDDRSFYPFSNSSNGNKCDDIDSSTRTRFTVDENRFTVEKMTSVSFSPNNRMIVAATGGKTVKLWRPFEEKEPKSLPIEHEDNVYGVSFSPDGQMIASASNDKTVKLWDIERRQELTDLIKEHTAPLRSVSFSPDGKMITAASQDETVKVWSVKGDLPRDFPPTLTLVGHENEVYGVSFSPDGKTIASAGRDNKVILWRLEGLYMNLLKKRACEWVKDFPKYSEVKEKDKSPTPIESACAD